MLSLAVDEGAVVTCGIDEDVVEEEDVIVNINNIGTMRICRTFTKTLVHYPMCELYYPINCQPNHVSMEVKFCAEQKNTAAVVWTSLLTFISVTLDYLFLF